MEGKSRRDRCRVMASNSLAGVCLALCSCAPQDAGRPRKGVVAADSHPELSKIIDAVFERYWTLGYDKLGKPEQVVVCVYQLEAEVNRGGFEDYYFNPSGNLSQEAVAALETIRATRTAQLLRTMNQLFGPTGPPADPAKRRERLSALGAAATNKMDDADQQFYKDEDKLEDLLAAFVSKNRNLPK
jgi:hypothetical protein